MRIWFWSWVIVAVVTATVSALARDRYSAPFAAGGAAAALLEALRIAIGWQWIAFFGVSSIVMVAFNSYRYRPRHAQGRKPRGS